MTKLVAAVCAALLLLSGCGGNDDDATAKKNIKASLLDQQSSLAGTKVTDEQAGCMADGLVDDIGVDQLKKYGILTKDLKVNDKADPKDVSSDDADALANTIVDCVDFKKVFMEQMGSSANLTDAQKKCVEDAIDEDQIKSMLSDNFQGKQTQMPQGMQSDLMKCMAPAGS